MSATGLDPTRAFPHATACERATLRGTTLAGRDMLIAYSLRE